MNRSLDEVATVAALAGGALDDLGRSMRPIGDDIMRGYSPVWRWVGGKCVRSYRCKLTGKSFVNRAAIMAEHFVKGGPQ